MLCLEFLNKNSVAMVNKDLKKRELDTLSGFWRAKGFVWAGWNDPLRLNRTDCYIVFRRKNWLCKDPEGNTLLSHPVLWTLLISIH